MTVRGRLFGPALATTGQAVSVGFDGQTLVVTGEGIEQRVAAPAISLARSGFDEQGMGLRWSTEAGSFALRAAGGADAAALCRALPPALAAQWQVALAMQRRRRRWRLAGWSALALALLAPLLVLALFVVFDDAIAAAVVRRIPPELEHTLSERALARLREEATLREEGPAAEAVQRIGERLVRQSRWQYRFFVAAQDSANAFALPGGVIVVNAGLIAMTATAEELAGVIAHEVEHVEQRHGLKALVRQLGLAALWAAVTGDLGRTLPAQAAQRLIGLGFSREAEREADTGAVQALVSAGIDPTAMLRFFARLGSMQEAAPPAWLSTHPPSEARREYLQSALPTGRGGYRPLLPDRPWPPATAGGE